MTDPCTNRTRAFAGPRHPHRSDRLDPGDDGGRARFVAWAVLLCLFTAPPASALPADCDVVDAGGRQRLEELYRRGNDYLYNLDYRESQEAFEAAITAFPDHPGPRAWLATALWMREMFRLGELSLEGYMDVGRFKEPDDLGSDERREKLAQRIQEVVERGLANAETWIRDPGRRVEGRFYRGLLKGIRAGFQVLVQHRFLSSIGDAKAAVSEHEKILERHPDRVDAAYVVGTFNYVVGKLPWYVKILSFFVGVRGDAEKGYEQLQAVAEKGDRFRDAARVTLSVIHAREGRPDRSAELLVGLQKQYPRNYLLALNRAVALGMARRWGEAASVYAEIAARIDDAVPNYQLADPLRVDLEWGRAALRARRAPSALEAYGRILERSGSPERAVTLALLGKARAHDLAGNRERAVELYRRVLERDEVDDSHDRSRRGLERRYR